MNDDAYMCVYIFMRTSVDIPDDLYRRAKVYAAEHGKTLRQLIIDGLESQISPASDAPLPPPKNQADVKRDR